MIKNDIHSGKEFKEKLLAGIHKVSSAVSSTLGAKGQTVIIQKEFQIPHITKDGVTVAKAIELKDNIENIGAKLIKQASEQTNREAGDGTTTSTLLASSMVGEGYKYVTAGVDSNAIRRGMEKTTKMIVKELEGMSKEITTEEEIKAVANVSANGDKELSDIVSEALTIAGKDGIIMVENSPDDVTYFEKHDGYSIDRGFHSPYFSTDMNKFECVYENASILLVNGNLDSVQPLTTLLNEVSSKGEKLCIFCDAVTQEVLQIFIQNKMRGVINCCLIKNDGFGQTKLDILNDIAIITGTKVFNTDTGDDFTKIKSTDLGTAKKIVADRDKTTILKTDKIDAELITTRVATLQDKVKDTSSAHEKKTLEKRIAKLSGGIGVIFVGASTETELKEKKDRLDDATNATKSALDSGVVTGAGLALYKLSEEITPDETFTNEELFGFKVIMSAIKQPAKVILKNAGLEASVILNKIVESEFELKYDVRKDEYLKSDDISIIDPTKVVKYALIYASSTASLILTSNFAVVTEDQPDMDLLERSSGVL